MFINERATPKKTLINPLVATGISLCERAITENVLRKTLCMHDNDFFAKN